MSAPSKFLKDMRRYVRNRLKLEKKLSRKKENTFKVDTLEPRILLSADPVVGALHDEIVLTEDQTTDKQTDQELQISQDQTISLDQSENKNIIELEDLLNDPDSVNTLINIEDNEILKGTGTFEGGILNDGTFAPGHSPGVINVDGDYTQASDATLEIEIWGAGCAGDNTALGDEEYGFDQLNINGVANLDGKIEVSLLDTYTPEVGDTYTIMTYDSYNGFFNEGQGLYGFHSDYYFEVVQTDIKIDLVVREIVEGDFFEMTSPNLTEEELTTFNDSLGMILNSDDFAGATQSVAFNGAINIVDTFVASGEFTIGSSLSQDVTVVDEGDVNTSMFTFSATDLDVQLGADNFGLTLDDTDFSMAIFSSNLEGDDRSWLVSEATTATAGFNGLDFVDFTATNISLDVSMGLGEDNSSVLDLSNNVLTVGSFELDTDGIMGEHTSVDAAASLAVGDFFEVSGDFAIDKFSKDLTLSDASTTSTDIFTIGANNINTFIGMDRTGENRQGFDVVGSEFALAFINDEDNNKYTSLGLEAASASIVGIDDFTLSAANILANKNSSKRDDGVVVDFSTVNLDVRTAANDSLTLNKEGINGGSYDVGLTGVLKVGELFETSGNFNVSMKAAHEVVLAGDAQKVNTSMMAFSATDLDIFIGEDDFGIDAIDTDFAMAYFKSLEDNDTRKWLNMESVTSNINLKGLPEEITIEPSDIGLYINQGLGEGNESVVNLSGDNSVEVGGIVLDNNGAKGEQVTVDMSAKLAIADYLYLEGDFSIEKLQKNLALSDGTTSDTNIFTFGGDDVSLFAGVNRTKDDELGLNVINADFAVAVIKDTSENKYTSVSVDADGAELTGIDSLTLEAGRTLIDINKSKRTDGVTVDFETTSLDVRTSGTTSITMDTKGIDKGSFDATVNDAEFTVDQFVHVSGSALLSLGNEKDLKVQSAAADETELSLKDIKASYIEVAVLDADVFVGYGESYFGEGENPDSMGLYLNDVDVALASYKQLTTSANYDSMSFTSLKATAANAGIVGTEDYLEATLTGVVLDVNIGKSSNTLLNSYVDYKATFGDTGRVFEFDSGSIAFDYDTSIIGVSVSNAHLELSEFLYLDGAIAFTKNTTLDATINNGLISGETTSLATLDVLTISGYNLTGFAGVGGDDSDDRAGVEVVDASFAGALMKTRFDAPAHLQQTSFLAAKASIGNVSLLGMEAAVTADFQDIEININTGKSSLNTTAFEPLPNVNFKASTADNQGLKVSTGLNSGNNVEGEDFFMLDFDKELVELSVGSAELSFLGALQARGAVTLSKKNEEVYLKGESKKTTVQTFSLGLKDAKAFIGAGDYFNTPDEATGFAVDDLDLGAALMRPTQAAPDSLVQYFAVNSSLQSAAIVGASNSIDIDLSKFNFEANVSIINGVLGGVADPVVDLSRSGENGSAYIVKTGSNSDFITLDYDSFLTQTSGHMVLATKGIFEIDTFFDMKITEDSFGLFIGDGSVTIGSDDTYKIAGVDVEGMIAINEEGMASKLEVISGLDLGDTLDLDTGFNITMNTMGKEYTYFVPEKFKANLDYEQIVVSATPSSDLSLIGNYIELEGNAILDIAGAMDVSGDIFVMYSENQDNINQKIKLEGQLTSDLLSTQNVVVDMGMDSEGTYGALEIGGTVVNSAAFAMSGNYIVQFNNTSSSKTLRDIIVANGEVVSETTYELGAFGKRLAGDGIVNVAGEVELSGPVDLAFSADGIEGDVDLTLDLGGFGDTQIDGALAVLNTNEGPVLALNADTSLNIGADIVSIVGDGNVKINTSSQQSYAGVSKDTMLDIDLDGKLFVSTFEFKSISGAITLQGSEFKAQIDDAGFDFFGIAQADMSGFVTSTGSFDFSMDKSINVDLGPIWMKAGLDVRMADSGFSGSVWGDIGASVEIPYFYDVWEGEWLYKEFSASIGFDGEIEFSEVMAHIAAEIDIMGIKISGEETWYMSDSPLPVLANQSGGVLTLNIGDRADKKGDTYKDIINDKYIITSNGGDSVTVSSLGVEKTYTGVTKIVGYAGEGDDFISIGSGITAELDLDGGEGDDSFSIFSAASNSSVRGGAGDDYYFAFGEDIGGFYGEDGNDTFIGSSGDDIIDLGAGVNQAYGGSGDDILVVNEYQIINFDAGSGDDSVSLTTTLDEFEINDYQFKSDEAILNFTNSLETFDVDNTSALLSIKGGASTNYFGYTDINVTNSGDIDITGNSFNTTGILSVVSSGYIDVNDTYFIAQNGTVILEAASISGVMQTELKALSVKTTSLTTATNLVINEKDDLFLVDEGINIANGSVTINIEGIESALTLQEGVIDTSEDITIVADDIDFLSGTNKISSNGTFNLRTMNSGIDYHIGSTAESSYGNDRTTGDANGYMDLSQRDLAALADGFISINIGDENSKLYLGDISSSTVITDNLYLHADYLKVQGDVNTTANLYITVNNIEISSQNIHDPLGAANSGLSAKNIFLEVDEHMYVAGWVKSSNTLRVNINNTSQQYSFISDSSGLLQADTLTINNSKDMKIGSQISAKDLDIVSDRSITILDAGRVISNIDNSDINLQAAEAIYVNGVLSSGASYNGSEWIEDGINSNLTLTAGTELKLSGAISVSGDLELSSGSSQEDYANYFDTIPGKTITTIDLGYLNSVQNADMQAIANLFEENNITLGEGVTLEAIDSLKGFYDLTEAQQEKVANSLGYELKTGTYYFNPDAPADKQLLSSLTSGDVLSTAGYTYHSGPVYIKIDSQEIVTEFIEGEKADYSNLEIDWSGVTEPSINASFDSLTLDQKKVVAEHLGYSTRDGGENWVNLGADINDRYKTTFTQAAKIDYSNAAIAWGDAGVPSENATFASLTTAQKDVVAHALGYEVYHDGVYVNFDAEASFKVVDSLNTGDYIISSINWGGVEAPSGDASFGELSFDQQAVVVKELGFTEVTGKKLLYNADENDLIEEIEDYSSVVWSKESGVPAPAEGVPFSGLTSAQRAHVLDSMGYVEYEGVSYVNEDGVYKATFEHSDGYFSYENNKVAWSVVEVPNSATVFENMSELQQELILDAIGYTKYETTFYYDANNEDPNQRVRTDFELGVDYVNRDIDFGNVPLQQNRWLIDDAASGDKYIIYAEDIDEDGIFETLKLQEAPKLTGQRGFGVLMNGTLNTFKDNADLVFSSDKDVIFRGNVNILGDSSNLTLQSDAWVYAEGQFDVSGDLTILGGISLEGVDLGGSNAMGDSVYIGKTTTLNTKEAGTTITIKGSKDVDILGVVVAGGVVGENGVEFSGVDSSVVVEAGEQVYVDTVLTASSNVSITTTGDLSEKDNGKSVILTKGAGLSTGGMSSDATNGGGISIDASYDVSVMSMILSGGTKTKSTTTNGYDVTYSDKLSTLSIISGGQAYIGGLAKATDGSMFEVGSTLTATGSIYVEGGDSSDGVSVRLPGTAKLITNDANSIITIKGSQNVNVSGVMVAGGEATDVYDDAGRLLGTDIEYFSADKQKGEVGSSIIIEAGYQAKIQRSVYAGHLIDIRGGLGDIYAKENTVEGEELSLFVDQGVVIGSKVQLKTSQENSNINLSSSGNLIVTAPVWTQEIKADGFAKNANGVLDEDVTLHIQLDTGMETLDQYITLNAQDTSGFTNLLELKEYIQTQIISSMSLDEEKPEISLDIDDGKLMFVGDYQFKILADSTNVDLIGLKLQTDYETARAYAIDASQKGSTVNIGKEGENSGDVTIAGKVIGYEGINFYSGEALEGFTQNVDITATAILETLNGGMVIDPGASGAIYGTFIARGLGSNIEINTTDSIDIHGSLIAQEDIIIKAGSEIKEGEVSIQTYGTGKIQTLSDGGIISLIGVNDVNIDTTIGQDGADLRLVELGSTNGTLTLNKESGRVETAGQIKFTGNDLVLEGVIKSEYKTDDLDDFELEIETDGDITLSGDIQTKGSIKVNGGGDVQIFNTSLIADELGDRVEISAGKNLLLGTTQVVNGEDQRRAVIIEANESLSVSAGEILNIGYDAQVYSMSDNSTIDINADELNIVGVVKAGQSVVFGDVMSVEDSGVDADIIINTNGSLILGGKALDSELNLVDRGVNLQASGDIDISAGANSDGIGMVISSLSSLRTSGDISVQADGSMQIDGLIKADGADSDVSISSDGMMFVDALVYATDDLSVTGGTSEYGVGLYLEEFTFDDEGNRLTGGTLDTAVDGTITVGAYEDVYLYGVVGQLDGNSETKTSDITLSSQSGKINIYQNIDAKNSVTIDTHDLNLLQSTHIFTSQSDSSISIDASGEVYIEKAQDENNTDAQIKTYSNLDIQAGSMVVQGLIDVLQSDSTTVIDASGDVAITGIITANGTMSLDADDLSITSQAKLDVEGDLDITTTGTFDLNADASVGTTKVILVPQFVTSEKTIMVPGGTQEVENGSYTVEVSAGLTPKTYTKTDVYKETDVGDKYYTMDIRLTQDGYYKKSTNSFKEFFIEGVDYSNNLLDGVSTDFSSTDYKTWSELSEDQQQIVLNNLGYKEAFRKSTSDIVEHSTKDGVVTNTAVSYSNVPWYGTSYEWVNLDVDGFRDKYVYMEVGYKDYILSATYESSSNKTETVGSYIDHADFEKIELYDPLTESQILSNAPVFTWMEGKVLGVTSLNPATSATTILEDIRWGDIYASIENDYNNNYVAYENSASNTSIRDGDFVNLSEGYYHLGLNGSMEVADSLTNYDSEYDYNTISGSTSYRTYYDASGSQITNYNGYIAELSAEEMNSTSNTSRLSTDYDFATQVDKVTYTYNESSWVFRVNDASNIIGVSVDGLVGDQAHVGNSEESLFDSTVTIETDLYKSIYSWESDRKNITDKRTNYVYSLATQNEDIIENIPVIVEYEEMVESFVDQRVTLWKTVSVPESEQTIQYTELQMIEGQGRSVAQFGSKTISAENITITTGDDVNIKGAIEATENFTLNSDGGFSLNGITTQDSEGNDIELLSIIDAKSVITIDTKDTLTLADKSSLELSDENGAITLNSEGSMLLDGEVLAGGTVDIDAGGKVELKSKIKADQSISIEVTNGSQLGGITTNEEVVLQTTDLTLSAGQRGGELIVQNSLLEVSDTLNLNANGAKITQIDSTISADTLNMNASDGIVMKSTANNISANLSSSGNINILNYSSVILEDVQAADGSVYIEAYGDITAVSVKTLGGTNRNNITLTSVKEDDKSAAIVVGTIEAMGDGAVTLNAIDSITKNDGVIKANSLTVKAGTQIDLDTDVDTISLSNTKEDANVVLNQTTTKEITLDDVKVANGTFDLTTLGSVVINNVEMLTDAKDVSIVSTGDISVDSLIANGAVVTLESGGKIEQSPNDIEVDISAKVLNLNAQNGIGLIETSIDELSAATTAGSLAIKDSDTLENSSGLFLANIVAQDTIDIISQNNISTKTGSNIDADTVKLESQKANIDIVNGATLSMSKGISVIANEGFFSLDQFYSGTQLTQYESSKDFDFGDGVTTLGDISSDTVILKTTGNIIVDGEITSKDLVSLEAGANISLNGIAGSNGDVTKVELTATGEQSYEIDGQSVASGDIVISEGIAFDVADFEIRAKNDIYIDVADDFNVNGFIGGVQGYEASENITINAGSGALNIDGSIIKANGLVSLGGANINSDLGSVFIASDLKAVANGAITLNTMVDTIEIDSLVSGDVSILEADDIEIKRADVHDGSFKIIAGGDITASIVRTHVDDASNDIILQASGTITKDADNVKATTFGTKGSVSSTEGISSDDGNIYMSDTVLQGNEILSGTSSYTVIKLPIVEGGLDADESLTIKSGTAVNDDLTIIAPINIGAGDLVLQSGGAVSLGDMVTADKVTATSSGNINMESQINTLDLTVSGSGDVNVSQSGDLTVENLETNGGDVYFYVDGDVVFNNVIGSANSFTVEVSDGHSITVNGQTYSSGATVFSANSGNVTSNVDMTTLELISSGSIDLSDTDGFSLDSYVTIDRTQNFSINSSSGQTVIDADISREGAGELTLQTGSLSLNKSLSSNTDISIISLGSFTMAQDVVIDTADGKLSLSADGDIKISQLKTTSSEDVTITSSNGAIIDNNGLSMNIDTSNANVVLSAKNGIGSLDALETNMASVDIANSASGDVNLDELNDLTITSYTNGGAAGAVTAINGDMAVSDMSAGSSSTLKLDTNNITIGGAITTTGASVDILANKGDITLTHSITARSSGSISLESVKGNIDATAEGVILSAQNGDVSFIAYGTIDADIDAKSLFISSTSKADINIDSLQDLNISGESLAVVNIDTPSGEQTIVSEFNTGEENIDFTATDIDIQSDIKTTGDIFVKTESESKTLRIGGNEADNTDEYTLNLDETKLLDDTINTLIIGSDENTGDIIFGDDVVDKSEVKTIEIKSDLEVKTDGKTFVNSNLEAESFKLYGPHYTLALNADISSDNEIEIHDSVKVGGDNSIVAGTYMVLSSDTVEFIQGDGIAGDDKLTLNANGGNIDISGNIGASTGTQFDGADVDNLEEFNIVDLSDNSAGAVDVNIAQDLYVDGDVTIYATGDVVFGGVVNISGSFNVIGADSITFAGAVSVANDMSLEANEIDFDGVANSVDVDGVITLKAADPLRTVLVGQDNISTSALNIDNDDMSSIVSGYSAINFGKAGGGDVQLSTANDFDSALGVYGKSITIQNSDINDVFNIANNIDINASANIILANSVETSSDVSMVTSGGKIKLNTNKTLSADSLILEANSGIGLDRLDVNSLSAINNGSGDIELNIIDGAASDIVVSDLKQLDATANSDISITHENGSLSINGATLLGDGDLDIEANKAEVTLTNSITMAGGNLGIEAKEGVTVGSNSDITITGNGAVDFTTTNGSIVQNSNVTSQGGTITYVSADSIEMSSDALTSTFSADSDDSEILFDAGGNISLGSVGSDGTILIETDGLISDNTADDTVMNLFGETTIVEINALNGVGASGTEDIDTDIASVSVLNRSDNGIYIENKNDLTLNNNHIISKSLNGSIELSSLNGDLIMDGVVINKSNTGDINLSANNSIVNNIAVEDQKDIQGANLILEANDSIDDLDVDVDSLSVSLAAGDLNIVNEGDIKLNTIDVAGTFDIEAQRLFNDQNSTLKASIANINLSGLDLAFGTSEAKISTDIGTLNLNYTAADINIDEVDDLIINTDTANKITLKGGDITVVLSDTDSSFGTKEQAANTDITSLDLTVGEGVVNIHEQDDISLTVTQTQNDTDELTLVSRNGNITINSNIVTDSPITYEADELIFNTNAQDMLGSSEVRANTDLNKITGADLSDIYINEVDGLVLDIQSANDVDIKTAVSGISIEQNVTISSIKLEQQNIINNAITDKLTVSNMNLTANDGIDIDLGTEVTLTLESNNGDIKVSNTDDITFGAIEDKNSISVKNNKQIDISAKSITFNTNDGYKDIKSIGNGDVKLTSTGGDITISKDMELGSSEFSLDSSNNIDQNADIYTANTGRSYISAGGDYIMSADARTEALSELEVTAANIKLGKITGKDTLIINATDIQEAQDHNSSVKLVSDNIIIDADGLGKEDNLLEVKTLNFDTTNENSAWYYSIVTNPTVDITTGLDQYANEEFEVTFTFSDEVSGFEIDDIDIQNAAAVSDLTTNDGIVYKLTLKPANQFEGELIVNIDEDKAFDVDNYGNIKSLQYSVNADTVLPTVKTIYEEKDSDAFREDPSLEYTFIFSEGIYNFTPDDIIVQNGTADGSFSTGADGDTVYQLKITPDENFTGMMNVYINGGRVDDAAGNSMLKSQVSSQKISSSVYGTYGNLVLETKDQVSLNPYKEDFGKEFKGEHLREDYFAQLIYVDIENSFNIDNTMLPGFDLISLNPANLADFERDEFLYEYWTNTFVM